MRKRVCIYICVRVFMFVYVCVDAKYGVCEFYVCMHGCILFRLPLFQSIADQASGRVDDKGQEDSCGFDGRESLE